MNGVINEILVEIKNKCECNEETYEYLKSFITVKLKDCKIIKEETRIVQYEESENEKIYKMFFISKKLQGLSDRSLVAYRTEINKILKNIKKPLTQITTDDIKYYLACYKLKGTASNVTIDNARRYISTFFQFMEDEEYIIKNPVKKIKKIKQEKKIKKAFSFEEIEKLKMQCEKIKRPIDRKRMIAIIETLLSTGARADELINMKLKNVNFETGEISIIGKGNKERIVYLNASALLRVKEYLKVRKGHQEYLFLNLSSPYGQMGTDNLGNAVKHLGRKAGVKKVHPHRFRRTCATVAKKRGMPIEEIQKLLGHEDLGTTQIYVQVDADDIKKSHERFMN